MAPRSSSHRHHPWLHWLAVAAGVMGYFGVSRCVALAAIMDVFGTPEERTWTNSAIGLVLGALEDALCAAVLLLLLWGFDCVTQPGMWRDVASTHSSCCARFVKTVLRFVVYLALFVVWILPFGTDALLVRIRRMRFTFEFIEAYFNAKGAASLLRVSEYEVRVAYESAAATAVVVLLFASACTCWVDLSLWSPNDALPLCGNSAERWKKYEQLSTVSDSPEVDTNDDLEDAATDGRQSESLAAGVRKHAEYRSARRESSTSKRKWLWWSLVALLAPALLVSLTHASSPIVASIALNTSLNEFLRVLLDVELYPGLASAEIAAAALYLSTQTERYELFKDNVLYRRTLGFQGDLAFNVSVDARDPPNVLVVAVESFRYHDSQYLVGNNTQLLNGANITVTPHFDRWAKRGVAFRNMWSSWTTSRSLESILFGQVPFDSIPDSGTSGGRVRVKLSGMPQFFKAKGYEPTFFTGSPIVYDQWASFLPSHGFDTVLAMDDIKRLAEHDLGIRAQDWALPSHNGSGRAMSDWGVHDDVAFQVLANLVRNKTREQRARVGKGDAKRPFFINHYTISSHTPYRDRPQWYDAYPKPDFSPLYAEHVARQGDSAVKDYLEMRYFQDLALGTFLDRMQREGILNDTIVVVVGDHGQGPEHGLRVPESRQISATRVAAMIVAEGRLGDHAGLLIDDAVEHYDLLNTLADIVGVPPTGFLQTSVGRSLKRRVPFGERVVWSNNPSQRMAAVRGHLRLQYDALSTSLQLHDTERDHELEHDLFPSLSDAEKRAWLELRDAGRHLNLYFKHRWKRACVTSVTC